MCIMCGNGISESAYSCIRCEFHLHKLCAKLPENINHHPHHNHSPGHPLTLVRGSSDQKVECKVCSWNYRGYGYSCDSCVDVDVDVGCASDALAINHTGHRHPLHPFLNMASFNCHACGTVHPAGVSYKCKTCPFWVHEDCATLPTTVRYLGHTHPLSLIVGYRSLPSWLQCQICGNPAAMHWTYRCRGCFHFVHVNCLAASLIAEINKTYEVDPEIDLSKVFQVPQTFQYHDLVLQMMNHAIIHYYGENKEVSPFYHFTHKHPLTLCNQLLQDSNNKKTVCSACMLPVSSPQVHYSCTECNNFFLHEPCAKLPVELQHPIHPHPLFLGRVVVGLGEHGGRKCFVCHGSINGLLYSCTDVTCEGYYFVHIRCILPHAISHTTHQHPLRLYEPSSKQGCVACPDNHNLVLYGCKSCGFYLHYHCALQPITIVHRYDKHHPFTLIVDSIEGGPDEEYVCEFCERHINPKWWFYHCLPCDLSACADCIFKKNRFNFHIRGIGRFSYECHNHLLSLIQVDKENEASLCFTCKKDFLHDKYVLYCARCNMMLHYTIGCYLISSGVVIRNEQGCCVAGRAIAGPIGSRPKFVEAYAMRAGFQLAKLCGLSKVMIEGDAKILLEEFTIMLTGVVPEGVSETKDILLECVFLANSFEDVKVKWIGREYNIPAHIVATRAKFKLFSEQWFDRSPPWLEESLFADVTGFVG